MLSDSPSKTSSTMENSCQKKQLYISFYDLNWHNWVIAPDGYDANYCQGRCGFPMPSEMNATNHAYVQNMVHILNAVTPGDERPPFASCAPKDLTTISVLYYDYSNNVVLKKFARMVVKSCGCM